MRRFFAWMVALLIAFALLIVVARAVGNAQPPEAIHALHLTDCKLPCWLGITPGETSFAEAVQRFKVAYPKAILGIETLGVSSHLGADSPGGIVAVYADQAKMVSTINLFSSDEEQIKLGDIASVLGVPKITCRNTPPTLIYYYDEATVFVIGDNTNEEGWQQHLFRIIIDKSSTENCKTLEYLVKDGAARS